MWGFLFISVSFIWMALNWVPFESSYGFFFLSLLTFFDLLYFSGFIFLGKRYTYYKSIAYVKYPYACLYHVATVSETRQRIHWKQQRFVHLKTSFMPMISFYCRTCQKLGDHVILHFDHTTHPSKNFSKLKCIHCPTAGFVVEYHKEATAPTLHSKRVDEVICTDEQPSDCF